MAEKPTHTAGNRENREAAERYRKGVKETTEELGEEEREKRARDVRKKDLKKDRQAEEKGKSRARDDDVGTDLRKSLIDKPCRSRTHESVSHLQRSVPVRVSRTIGGIPVA